MNVTGSIYCQYGSVGFTVTASHVLPSLSVFVKQAAGLNERQSQQRQFPPQHAET